MASGEKSKEAAPRPGGPGGTRGMLSLDDLKKAGEEGTIDTIVTAFTDMQGRLFGKRIEIEYFLDEVDGPRRRGLQLPAGPRHGHGAASRLRDGELGGRLRGLRDRARHVDAAPDPMARPHRAGSRGRRQRRRQPRRRLAAPDPDRRLRARPWRWASPRMPPPSSSSTSTRRATPRPGRRASRTSPRRSPTSSTTTSSPPRWTRPTWGRSAGGCTGAGIPIEFSKGEAWYGQHEVNFRYADAVTSADRHTIYKNGVKEIAFLNEISASFMAKPSEDDIGSSCHLHQSLVDEDGKSVFVDGNGEETDTFMHFIGGMRNHIRELALFVAPAINSYKRYAAESWAPTSVSWGRDNRTCGFRVVGHGQSRRVECRIPGADANPYLAFAALLAAGLDGIENKTDPGPELKGNAYEAGEAEAFPSSLREAVASVGEVGLREEGVRRSGPQALPQLRPARAGPVRQGRDGLRAPPHVRARLARPGRRAGGRARRLRAPARARRRRSPGRAARRAPSAASCRRAGAPLR